MKKYRLPLACALVVLLSLALPFAVFSLWDKALLSAPHSQTAAEGLSAEARANSTACTLYACSHVLNVPLGYNSGSEPPWAQTAIDDATLDRARSTLHALHDAGLLTDVQLAKALAVCTQNDKATTWNAATAPGGLTQVSCNVIGNFDDESPDSYSSFALNLILTSADTPVYFNYQDGQDTTHLIADAAYLQKYSTLLGLDSFADWQYPDWRAAVQDFGVAAYSETAQLYLTANCRYGITLSAASMTPQDYADLDALYAKGDTP